MKQHLDEFNKRTGMNIIDPCREDGSDDNYLTPLEMVAERLNHYAKLEAAGEIKC